MRFSILTRRAARLPMEKIWLKSYPEGVPAEVDVREFSSLKDILEKSCERYRDLPAFSNMGTTLTYSRAGPHESGRSAPTCRAQSACPRAIGWH